ncbi:MAG: hypothetical protein LBU05_05655, partial [Bifidobacteriaceae bacterium]|nr:hypothetical protein [Bifidobacteriaceae bacterium]
MRRLNSQGQPPARSLLSDVVWGLGAQALLGGLLGLVWLAIAPRPAVRWAGTFWYAESETGF